MTRARAAKRRRSNALRRASGEKTPQPVYFTQEDPIGLAGGLNLYGYAGGDPINNSDPFGLCPEKQRDADGNCPGGLSVDEWSSVESAANQHLSNAARRRVIDALNDGRIRGDNLDSDVYGEVFGMSPDVIRLNRSASWGGGTVVSAFNFDPLALARIVAHEDRHVQQLREFGWFTRVFGGSKGFHTALEADADGYALVNLLNP